MRTLRSYRRLVRGLVCGVVMAALLCAPLAGMAARSRFERGAHLAAWTATAAPATAVRAGGRLLRTHVTPVKLCRSAIGLRRVRQVSAVRPAHTRSIETLPTHWGAVHLLI